jgi:hypothetical protein
MKLLKLVAEAAEYLRPSAKAPVVASAPSMIGTADANLVSNAFDNRSSAIVACSNRSQ